MTDTQPLEPTVPSTNGTGRGGRQPSVNLTDDQQVEIIDMYTRTLEPVGLIAKHYGIQETYVFNVLGRAGITWRRKHALYRSGAETFDQWQARQQKPTPLGPPPIPATATEARAQVVAEVPEPVEKALERMLRLPPKPEPVAQPRPQPVQVEATDPNESVWEISYVGRMLVRAQDIDQALDRARQDGHLTQIVGVTLRSR
jgi:hypothetical protein